MVHKKYIKKGGKKFGPYLYETKRVNGKVVTRYVGKPGDVRKRESKITSIRRWEFRQLPTVFILVLFAIFLFRVFLFAFSVAQIFGHFLRVMDQGNIVLIL